MNDMITIENTEMQIREYAGQRVVTLKDIDMVHGKKSDTAKKSFQKHKKHFILGTDYFEMTRKEFGERYSPNEKVVGNPNIKTYLFTESGYLMIVKVFNDDIAWNVQRQLVNAYFKEKKQNSLSEYAIPVIEHKVSSVPAPRNTSWFYANKIKIDSICKRVGCSKQKLLHFILGKLGEEFDLETSKLIYIDQNGYPPVYAMDIADYFPDIAERATYIVNRLYETV